ncbi:MAG: trypsin-like serine protease [Halioglobus sp.]
MVQSAKPANNNISPLTLILQAVVLILSLLGASSTSFADPDKPELREIYNESSPEWLQSVGRLDVPGIKYANGHRVHHRENCSATLVGSPGKRASYIVTAWHCLEFYRDLSHTITFNLDVSGDEKLILEVRPIIDGGSMNADWAILELVERTPHPDQPFGLVLAGSEAGSDAVHSKTLSMAGYSRDPGLGASGAALTYHANCESITQGKYSTSSNCQAYKGASGGAVVTYSQSGAALFTGVISEGDSEGTSTFVPVSNFRSVLNRYIR